MGSSLRSVGKSSTCSWSATPRRSGISPSRLNCVYWLQIFKSKYLYFHFAVEEVQRPSPADSLHEALAGVSQEPSVRSLPSSPPTAHPRRAPATLPSVSPITQSPPQGGASSRLFLNSGPSAVADSAIAPRSATRNRSAGSPASTPLRSPLSSPRSPTRTTRTTRPRRSPAASPKSKRARPSVRKPTHAKAAGRRR